MIKHKENPMETLGQKFNQKETQNTHMQKTHNQNITHKNVQVILNLTFINLLSNCPNFFRGVGPNDVK